MLQTTVARLARRGARDCIVAITPDDAVAAMRDRFDGMVAVRAQGAGDLGARLAAVSERVAAERGSALALIGTDSPDLPLARLDEAEHVVATGRGAICGCPDGGYCLLAIPRPCPALFAGIDWGTPRVLDQTRHAAREAGLELVELGAWPDVDTAEDLRDLARRLERTDDPELRRLRLRLTCGTLRSADRKA
jgi:hypothetical protein